MNPLDSLRRRLHRRFAPGPQLDGLAACDPEALARIAAVREAFSPPRGHRSLSRVSRGVMAFRLAGREAAFADLKYACYGVARPTDWEGRILLADPLLDQLLAAVDGLRSRPRRYCECYRGLLTAWLADVATDKAFYGAAFLRSGVAKLEAFIEAGRVELAGAPRQSPWIVLVREIGPVDDRRLRQALGLAGHSIVVGHGKFAPVGF